MNTRKLKSKLRGFWRSRTVWGGALLGVLTGAQVQIMEALKFKLDKEDYAVAGAVVFAVIALLRWATTEPLDSKGEK